MDLHLPGDDDPRRLAVRAWLAEHPDPSPADLAAAGYVAPHWPRPWGLDADALTQLVVDEELRRAGVRRPDNPLGIGWAGPTIVFAGTAEQQQRWLPRLLTGEDYWCQLFSEPDAGSDLASLRTRAVRDGDEWVVDGVKVWSSHAERARFGILLARTDPDVAPHKGISYFVVDMHAPGVRIDPLVAMNGQRQFNQVTLDRVRIPGDHLLGRPGDGWRLAKVTLGNERVSLSGGGLLWGQGPTTEDLLDLVRSQGGISDPVLRQRAAALYAEATVLRLLGFRLLGARLAGRPPGPEASVRKTLADEHAQRVFAFAKDLTGAGGMLDGAGPLGVADPTWHLGFLFSPALTIGGGTAEVQRNILAERLLGLPSDPRPRPADGG